jgi:hypothetical protein
MIPSGTWTHWQTAKETHTTESSCHVAGAAVGLSFMHSATWASVITNYSAVFTSGFGVAKSIGSKAAIG